MQKTKCGLISVAFCLLSATTSAIAGEADVKGVEVTRSNDKYDFSVTVQHADEGWDHYANKWEVVGEDGTVYATRVLAHPHVGEQPFTRSLSGVELPDGVTTVIIRAADSVHELGGQEMAVKLSDR